MHFYQKLGGPFVLNDQFLMGIVSFGNEKCGKGVYPGNFFIILTDIIFLTKF